MSYIYIHNIAEFGYPRLFWNIQNHHMILFAYCKAWMVIRFIRLRLVQYSLWSVETEEILDVTHPACVLFIIIAVQLPVVTS